MYFAELAIILSSCFYSSQGFGFNGLSNGYRFFIKELNNSLNLFDSAPIETNWIEQPLDHFDSNETRTWKMRYFERLDLWKNKGPIYLFINGEGEASELFLQTGIMYDLAKETNGAMFLSEHRYYGKSKPFKKINTETLAYLSSRQALADIAKLLETIKTSSEFEESKVVVVGGSYAGNLAAWMRLLYPELVDAAISSSAPVLAKKDFYEYLENVSDDFEQQGTPGCYNKIVEIFKRYDELLKTDSGIAQLIEEEQICNNTDMKKPLNKQLFFLDKASEFMYEAQYGSPRGIKNVCDEIINTSRVLSAKDDETDLWSEIDYCYIYDFDETVELMRDTDWAMSWTYQTCTEFGYFMTTASDKQPFTDNIHAELYYSLCTKAYGPEFNERRVDEGVERTNKMYGGLKPNVTNVVFVNGDLDPWHRLGVLEDVSYDAPAKIIPLSSHCRDLFSDKSNDPEELKEARKYIKYLIKKWIGAGEYKRP
uniref:Serine protease K12H4.7 n=1 Tax=Heliothis virescens TaxID=7102 RepID=A0A2A4IXM3_HELVI